MSRVLRIAAALVTVIMLALGVPSFSAPQSRLWYIFTFEGTGSRLRLLLGPYGPADNPIQHARAAESMHGLVTPAGRLAPVSAMRMLDIPLPLSAQKEPSPSSASWWNFLHVEGTRDRSGGWLYVLIGSFASGTDCTNAIGKMLDFTLPVGRLMLSSCERLAFSY